MMKTKRLSARFSVYILTAIIFFIVLAVPQSAICNATEVEFTLVVIIPETGNYAFLGDPIKNALRLAQEDWKEKLSGEGVSIKLVFGDSRGIPRDAVTVYNQKRATMKVDGLFSLLSGQTLALKPMAEQDGILFIASTVDPSVCEDSKYLIRPFYSFGAEGRAMVKIVSETKPKRAGIIYSIDSSSSFEVQKVVLPGLKAIGIPVTVQPFKPGNRDFRTQIVAIKKAEPETVLLFGFGPDLSSLVKSSHEQGLYNKTAMIGSLAIKEAIIAESTKPFIGMRYFAPTFYEKGYAEKNPDFSAFKKKFIAEHGAASFQLSAVYAYDTYGLLARALVQKRSTSARIIMEELLTKRMKGLAGVYIFEADGNCRLPFGFYEVEEDGNTKLIRVFDKP